MSPDPMAGETGDPQSLNRYAYALNDPVNRYDPLGLDWIWGWGWGGAWDWGGGIGGGPSGGFSILPGDQISLPQRSIEELLNDWLFPELGECSAPTAAFLPTCGPMTIDGVPIYSFGPGGYVREALKRGLKKLIPTVCGGGGFGYGGLAFEAKKLPVGFEFLGIVQGDSQEGGSHGFIAAGKLGKHVAGVEGTRTWRDWKEHYNWIYLPGTSTPVKSGPMKVNKDFGGIFQYYEGQAVVGAYGGLSGKKGRSFGLGGYLNLSWNDCKDHL